MLQARTVAFVTDPKDLARWRDIEALSAADVEREQQRFRSGIDVWIAQSYLLLREPLQRLGYSVRFGSVYPRGAICIAHWDDLNALFNGAHRGRVIGVRADRSPLYSCERVIVQNDVPPLAACERYIPLWPQPGLLPRDASRGTRVETIAYFGRLGRVPRWVQSDALRSRLAALGVTLTLSEDRWNDYRAVDLTLSLRVESPSMVAHKPATKLYNAWHARTPALLNDEPALVQLRQGPLDYLSVASADEVVAAVARLQHDATLYTAMVDNGVQRAQAFTRDAIAARWLTVINEVATARRPRSSLVGFVWSVQAQRREARRFRARHASEQAGVPL